MVVVVGDAKVAVKDAREMRRRGACIKCMCTVWPYCGLTRRLFDICSTTKSSSVVW